MTNQYKFKVEVINIISGQGGLVKCLENESDVSTFKIGDVVEL